MRLERAGASFTKVPTPGTRLRKPSDVNSRKALLAVMRLMPKLSTSSFSDGTRRPASQAPERMFSRMWSFTLA